MIHIGLIDGSVIHMNRMTDWAVIHIGLIDGSVIHKNRVPDWAVIHIVMIDGPRESCAPIG